MPTKTSSLLHPVRLRPTPASPPLISDSQRVKDLPRPFPSILLSKLRKVKASRSLASTLAPSKGKGQFGDLPNFLNESRAVFWYYFSEIWRRDMELTCKLITGDSRQMLEIPEETVELIVTSPPYWNLKDYGVMGQIGYGQSLEEYYDSLWQVWSECFRVLKPDRRLCINVGDVYLPARNGQRLQVVPIHARIIEQALSLGFEYTGTIIWHKYANLRSKRRAALPGSYPYPYNGVVRLDHEYILLFRRPGRRKRQEHRQKSSSRLTQEEWIKCFSSLWSIPGTRKGDHPSTFPDEIAARLIKMYSYVEETVLDPFAGTGTTNITALQLGRHTIGYEINPQYTHLIVDRIHSLHLTSLHLSVVERLPTATSEQEKR